MNGLELSKLYFQDVIRPMLLEQFPNDFERIAAGLVGEGSECFGYDDEISRDHDWGAKVCLWLDSAEYQENGEILQRKLMHLPNTYQGYPVCWIPNRNGVLEISGFSENTWIQMVRCKQWASGYMCRNIIWQWRLTERFSMIQSENFPLYGMI